MAVTIKDVARLAGVGEATVSRVLNNSGYVKAGTRAQVFAAIKELNYYPNSAAQNLSSNRTNTVAVVVPDITNPFFSDVIRGITTVLNNTPYSLVFFNCDEDPQRQINALDDTLRNRVRGLILSPTNENCPEAARRLCLLQKDQTPVVLLDRDFSGFCLDGVFIDNHYGAYIATKRLLEEGHRRIAIIHGPLDTMPGRDRLQGYLDAYQSFGLTPPEDCCLLGDFRFESGKTMTDRLLALSSRPSAILCCNNMMTMGCLKSLHCHGLETPDDIALIGFDALDKWDLWGENITVVQRATMDMGILAAQMLLKRIDGKSSLAEEHDENNPNRVFLRPQLLIRGSEKFIIQENSITATI